MAHSGLARTESRGAHQRLDGFEQRDDTNFLRHSLVHYQGDDAPNVTYAPVTITKSPPGSRAYGALGEHEEDARKEFSPKVELTPAPKDGAHV